MPIEVRRLRALRGPNVHAYRPVLEAIIDIQEFETQPSNSILGFNKTLLTMLPGLWEHKCSLDRPGGFVHRLETGTYMAHIIEHSTIELQNMIGISVRYGKARGYGEEGVYRVIISYTDEKPARACFDLALRVVNAAIANIVVDFADELRDIRDLYHEVKLGPSTNAIVEAARRRTIPFIRLNEGGLVQLGYGIYQKRIQASETTHTSAVAVDISMEKELTNSLLRQVGVPVPEGRVADSAAEAWEVAEDIGLPVVVKPQGGNQGKGVVVNLTTREQVMAAYDIADQYRGGVLVETFIPGDDYRLLVVGGKLVAAARRDAAMVVGDGEHTISELIGIVNRDPRRGEGHSNSLTKLMIDDVARQVLIKQGMTADSVPLKDARVLLRENKNLSTGGTATDVTDIVHPKTAKLAVLAAEIIGLDIAGIDVLAIDISKPLAEQNGAIVEINAAPGLRMHIDPSDGTPRDVGGAVIDSLFPESATLIKNTISTPIARARAIGRIPIVSITGTNGKTTVTRLVGHMFKVAHKTVGLTTTSGVWIGDDKFLSGDCSGPRSARAVLLNPTVEVAVLETARGGIMREGLGFDWCQVAVVTNISADHLGMDGMNTLQDIARVKQVVVESVLEDGGAAVLNADDPHVREMSASTKAETIYFSMRKDSPTMAAHLASGGRGVYVQDGALWMGNGRDEAELIELERVQFTGRGKIAFQVQNALAAVGALWACGINPALMSRGLATFHTDPANVPGRFNLFRLGEARVIVDYGHNPGALSALGQSLEAFPHKRAVGMIGAPGDRRDVDLTAFGTIAARIFDTIIIREDDDLRGRDEGEAARIVADAITHAGKTNEVRTILNETEAVSYVLQQAQAGDLIVVLADDVPAVLEQMRKAGAESISTEAGMTWTPAHEESGSSDDADLGDTRHRDDDADRLESNYGSRKG